MVEKIFVVLDGSSVDKHLDWPYVLVSAILLFNKKSGAFKRKYNFNQSVREVFLDSGGFSFMRKFGDYPFSPEDYASFARDFAPTYVAIMDYPCVKHNENTIIDENKRRIERTIDNTMKLLELANDVNWVAVVQGFSIDEYLYSIDGLKEQGLITPVVAIGSLFPRKSTRSLLEVLKPIRENLPKRVKLHGFGVGLRHLRNEEVRRILYSVDSSSWKFCNKFPGKFPRNTHDKLNCFFEWKRKVETLQSF